MVPFRHKILIITCFMVGVTMGGYALHVIHKNEQTHLESVRQTGRFLLIALNRTVQESMVQGHNDIRETIREIPIFENVLSCRIVSREDLILVSSDPAEARSDLPREEKGFLDRARGEAGGFLAGEAISTERKMRLFLDLRNQDRCHRCHDPKDEINGTLFLTLSLDPMRRHISGDRLRLTVASLVAIGLLLLGLNLWMRRTAEVPLRLLNRAMERVEEGDLEFEVRIRSRDEFGRLGESFNSMVRRLCVARGELKRLYDKRMERVDRLATLGELAARVAHEIRNPLAGISGAVHVLVSRMPEEDLNRPVLQEVSKQVVRINKTVTELLEYGRRRSPNFSREELNRLLEEALRLALHREGAGAIHAEKKIDDSLEPLFCDGDKIRQVLLNLVINAIQAMDRMPDKRSKLRVETRLLSENGTTYQSVRISDNGPGIRPEVMKRLFDAFYTTKARGTGLGLTIAAGIVKEHGGRIEAARVGGWTTFEMLLPVRIEKSEKGSA